MKLAATSRDKTSDVDCVFIEATLQQQKSQDCQISNILSWCYFKIINLNQRPTKQVMLISCIITTRNDIKSSSCLCFLSDFFFSWCGMIVSSSRMRNQRLTASNKRWINFLISVPDRGRKFPSQKCSNECARPSKARLPPC